ncbi:HEPN family nuclease [Nostoc sp.]|uniref:HEPN family nuclease n=1 Tax=Nostoc sp. TaxID=1180 RepID=UPI002FF8DAFF
MEYDEMFERDFIARTLEIVEQYEKYIMKSVSETQQFEVTLLINCLLGLLIFPREHCFNSIPAKPIDELEEWGLSPDFIQNWGRHPGKLKSEKHYTLVEFVYRLRNAVAHARLRPHGNGVRITSLEFTDEHDFCAVVPFDNLKIFVTKLAQSVKPPPKFLRDFQ